ncbi:MAG: transcriptional repressor LexA [Thermodesulfovibrionales bacterium]|nr:transcriptional repressor LexA [Thermodesulfovibrionales bacterium]
MERVFKERLDKLLNFYWKNQRMPSYSEIALLAGFRSKNGAYKFIQKLENLGFIKKDSKGRLIPGALAKPLRFLGTVEAGFPSPAEEELIDTLSLDRWLIENPSSTFMLRVTGDSMSEAGILPGDMVIVDRSLTPKNGDIVIAEVDGQWTMKYFKKEKNEIILLPANPKYKPLKPKKELKIGGVVIAVVRKYK